MPHSPLSESEWNDHAFDCQPELEQDLEALAMEPDGSAVIWNAEGKPVRIPEEERESVAALLIEGRFTVAHTLHMLEAAEETDSLVVRSGLIDCIEKLVRFIPRQQQGPVIERLRAAKQRGFIRALAIILFIAFALYGPDANGSFVPTLDNPDDDEGKAVTIHHIPTLQVHGILRVA